MADPVYSIKLELSSGSLTDVTSYAERASFSRKLNTIFSPVDADQALFQFSNDVGSFSPILNSGIATNRRVTFRANYNGSDYNLFSGRVRSVQMNADRSNLVTVIEAITEVDRLDKTLLRTALLIGRTISSLYTEVMTRSNIQSFTSGNLYKTVDFAWYQDVSARGALARIVETDYMESFVDGAGTFVLRERFAGGGFSTSGFVVSTLTEAFGMTYALTDRDTVNRFQLSAVPKKQSTDVSTLAYLGQAIQLLAGQSVGFFVDYYDPRNFSERTSVGSIVTPVASTDYYGSINADGTGAAVTLSLNFSGFAEAAVASLTNATNSNCWLTRFQVRGYPVLDGAALTVGDENAASQSQFGLIERSVQDALITDRIQLQGYASSLIADAGTPRGRVGISLKNDFDNIFGLDVGNVRAIRNVPTGINSFWSVAEIRHEVSLMQGLEHSAEIDFEQYKGAIPAVIGAIFRGHTSGIQRVDIASGVAQSPKGVISAWFQVNTIAGTPTQTIFQADNSPGADRAYLMLDIRSGAGRALIDMRGGGLVIGASTSSRTSLQPSSSAWHNVIAAWDSSIGRADICVDDVVDTSTGFPNIGNSAVTGVTSGGHFVPSYTNSGAGGQVGVSGLAAVWFKYGAFVDLNVVSNRRKFLTSSLTPVAITSDGTISGIGRPDFYFHIDRTDNASLFVVNRGTAGSFATIGSLTAPPTFP